MEQEKNSKIGVIIEKQIVNHSFILVQESRKYKNEPLLSIPANLLNECGKNSEVLKRIIEDEMGLAVTAVKNGIKKEPLDLTKDYSPFYQSKLCINDESLQFQAFVCEAEGVHLTQTADYRNIRWISTGVLKNCLTTPEKIEPAYFEVLQHYAQQAN